MNIIVLVVLVVVCQVIGLLGSIANIRSIPTWYVQLRKPRWNPPNSVFGPVWITLYLLISISGWRCWLAEGVGSWFLPFVLQLVFNLAWSWIFFGSKQIGLALVEMIVLWGVIAWNLSTAYQVDAIAGGLLIPYLLWVTYALSLNAGFWVLNRNHS